MFLSSSRPCAASGQGIHGKDGEWGWSDQGLGIEGRSLLPGWSFITSPSSLVFLEEGLAQCILEHYIS